MTPSRALTMRTRRSRFAALAVATVVLGLAPLLGTSVAHAAGKPPNPTDQQLQQAQDNKTALAGQVGDLTAQLATLQTQLQQAQGQKEAAEQKLALAVSNLEAAQAKATQAKAQVTTAQQAVTLAQQQLLQYAQAVYMTGNVGGTTGTLLTAPDPNALLDQSALQQYQASHQLTALGELQQATVNQANADSSARQAVRQEQVATDAATQAKQQADTAVQNAAAETAQVQTQEQQVQSELSTAADTLSSLNGQRQAYDNWKAQMIHQAWVAHQQELKRLAAIAAAKAAALLRQQQQAAAALAAQQAQQSSQNNNPPPPATTASNNSAPIPSGGSWTAAMGQQAVARAENWLGETYIWAGGNASGPTTGGCTDPIAHCGTLGFDCSGLALYAWAPFEYLPHYAASQYYVAGNFHPSSSQFLPGDLLFWSDDGTAAGIHHVAIYIGGGMVIQAPQSGDVVRETPWDQVDWGYFGATRPLT